MKKTWKLIKEYGVLTFGAVIYALGIALFLDPNNLAPGGITGVSIILSNYVPLETGTLYFLINIPIIIIGFLKLGRKLIIRTFYCILVNSVVIDCITSLYGGALTDDLMLAGIVGGAMIGAGIGFVMKQEGTTGGSDIIVRLLRKKYPHIKTGAFFSLMDYCIVAISAVVFKDIVIALYALLAVFVTAFVLDEVLYGKDEAKMLYIISDHSKLIGDKLLHDLDVGVTYLQGKGAYSGREKEVVMACMQKSLAPKVEEVVREVDPTAFMIVASANEIYGEGYKDIFGEKL